MAAGMTGTEKSSRSPNASIRRRVVVASIFLGLLIVALAPIDATAGLLRPPDRFPGDGSIIGAPIAVGQTTVVGVPIDDKSVRIDAVEPVLRPGSAVAAVEVVVCRQASGMNPVGLLPGAALTQYCDDVASPRGANIGADGVGSSYLLMIIRPLEAGTVVIEGVRVTHSRGPFHRTEQTGPHVELEVR